MRVYCWVCDFVWGCLIVWLCMVQMYELICLTTNSYMHTGIEPPASKLRMPSPSRIPGGCKWFAFFSYLLSFTLIHKRYDILLKVYATGLPKDTQFGPMVDISAKCPVHHSIKTSTPLSYVAVVATPLPPTAGDSSPSYCPGPRMARSNSPVLRRSPALRRQSPGRRDSRTGNTPSSSLMGRGSYSKSRVGIPDRAGTPPVADRYQCIMLYNTYIDTR